MAVLLTAPTKNSIQKTLAAQLLNTAGVGDPISFSDVDGIPNLPGVLVINRIDSNGTAMPSQREYIEYSGTSGTTVLITTRNVDGSASAMTHAVGSIVEWIPDVTWADRIYDALFNIVDVSDLSVDTTKIVTPTGTQTLTDKTLSGGLITGATISGVRMFGSDITLGTINSSGATISAILDEDNMASDRADAVPTQQSVKAYVTTQIPTMPTVQALFDSTLNNATFGDAGAILGEISLVLTDTAKVFINASIDARTGTNPASFLLQLRNGTDLIVQGTNTGVSGANIRNSTVVSWTGELASGTHTLRVYGYGGGQGATYTPDDLNFSVFSIQS